MIESLFGGITLIWVVAQHLLDEILRLRGDEDPLLTGHEILSNFYLPHNFEVVVGIEWGTS